MLLAHRKTLPEVPSVLFCGGCGKPVSEGDLFCGACVLGSDPRIAPPIALTAPPILTNSGQDRIKTDRKSLYIVLAAIAACVLVSGVGMVITQANQAAAVRRQQEADAVADKEMGEYLRAPSKVPSRPPVPWDGKGKDPNFPIR